MEELGFHLSLLYQVKSYSEVVKLSKDWDLL